MFSIALVTIKGIFRDKVFRDILVAPFLFPLISSISTFSMRQVKALSLTLSLSPKTCDICIINALIELRAFLNNRL